MDDMEYDEDDFMRMFKARTVLVYMQMTKVFAQFELPINLEPYTFDTRPRDMMDSVEHAREVLRDLPMPDELRAAANTAAVEWLTAFALFVFSMEEDVDWMAAAAILATHRAQLALDVAQSMIDGEFDIEQE